MSTLTVDVLVAGNIGIPVSAFVLFSTIRSIELVADGIESDDLECRSKSLSSGATFTVTAVVDDSIVEDSRLCSVLNRTQCGKRGCAGIKIAVRAGSQSAYLHFGDN